jgi:hypothetical protein
VPLVLLPDDERCSSPVARQLDDALRGRRPPPELPWKLLAGIPAEDLAWLVARAVEALRRGAEGEVPKLGRLVLLEAPGPVWGTRSAQGFLDAMGGLQAFPEGAIGSRLVGFAAGAAAALDPADRGPAREPARRLIELFRALPASPEPALTTEELLTLSAIAGGSSDADALKRKTADLADQPIALIELGAVARLSFGMRRLLTAFGRYRDDDSEARRRRTEAAAALAADPVYAPAARAALEALDARLDDLHAGRIPYQPDRLAADQEILAVVRAFEVASFEDAPWFGEIAGKLLPRLVVAPGNARTVPSQALASSLARTTAERSTPESVAALAEAVRVVRHAGVKKKIERELRAARKSVAEGGRILPHARAQDSKADRSRELTAFRAAMEASFDADPRPLDPWLRDLLADPVLGPPAADLIWSFSGPAATSAMWRGGSFLGLDGREPAIDEGCTVQPWHPAAASAEDRAGWRERVIQARIAQPIRQAFREWYAPAPDELAGDRTRMFAGTVAAARPLLGLARREGWTSSAGALRRETARGWAFELATDSDALYPGAVGPVRLGEVRVELRQGGRWLPARLGEVPPVTLSEGLRGVDLLCSVAGFAVADGEAGPPFETPARLDGLPITGQMQARRVTLEMLLRSHPEAGRIRFGERCLFVRTGAGEHRVHYATGLDVGPDGAVRGVREIAPAQAIPLPWLPYDETLLELVLRRTLELLGEPGGA